MVGDSVLLAGQNLEQKTYTADLGSQLDESKMQQGEKESRHLTYSPVQTINERQSPVT